MDIGGGEKKRFDCTRVFSSLDEAAGEVGEVDPLCSYRGQTNKTFSPLFTASLPLSF